MIYRWRHLPDARTWAERWQTMAVQHGLPGLYLVAMGYGSEILPPPGFDAMIISGWSNAWLRLRQARTKLPHLLARIAGKLNRAAFEKVQQWRLGRPEAYPAEEGMQLAQLALHPQTLATAGGENAPR